MSASLELRPVTLRQAAAFVAAHHRHCRPPRGCRFCLGAFVAGELVAVAVIGRPIARHLDDQRTAEITRLCAGPAAPHGSCSYLYAAARRAWQAMGGLRVVTYTLDTEPGSSLAGAGFERIAETAAQAWTRPGRLRPALPTDGRRKVRWSADCRPRPQE